MDVQRAKELLMVLADGIDPLTGEVLPDDHVCNSWNGWGSCKNATKMSPARGDIS